MLRHLMRLAALVSAWFFLGAPAFGQIDDLDGLRTQLNQLFEAGDYASALPVAQHVLKLTENANGPNSPEVANALYQLGIIQNSLGRTDEAIADFTKAISIDEQQPEPGQTPLADVITYRGLAYAGQNKLGEAAVDFSRALEIKRSTLGPEDPGVAGALKNLAIAYAKQRRYGEAIDNFTAALSIQKNASGSLDPEVAELLRNRGEAYREQQHFQDAINDYDRSAAIFENAGDSFALKLAETFDGRGNAREALGRFADAANDYEKALDIFEKRAGPETSDLANTLRNRGNMYENSARYAEALADYSRTLEIYQKVLGPETPEVARTLNDIGNVYSRQGSNSDAIKIYSRALAVYEKAGVPEYPDVTDALSSLGLAYANDGRTQDAIGYHNRVLAIYRRTLGPDDAKNADALNNRGIAYGLQGDYASAIANFTPALSIYEKVRGPEDLSVAGALASRGAAYENSGRFAEAIADLIRVPPIVEKARGANNPEMANALYDLAIAQIGKGDWASAEKSDERATAIIEQRTALGSRISQPLAVKFRSETMRNRLYFESLIKAAYRSSSGNAGAAMFLKAQSALATDAADAVTQMAVRGAKGDAKLSQDVRERQQLVAEWQSLEKAQTFAATQPLEKRNKDIDAANGVAMSAIKSRIDAINKTLKEKFRDYDALASTTPLSIADVQKDLREDEALILTFDTDSAFKPTPEETFIWVVTKTESRWVRSDFGGPTLRNEVAALRCGLDYNGWLVQNSICPNLTKAAYTDLDHQSGRPLPFDIGRSNRLYHALFGEVEGLLKDKSLLIVPSGVLTQLPFQVLVTEAPQAGLDGEEAFRKAQWLVRSHALSVLPAVSSLGALRRLAKPGNASLPYVAFANPLLDGDDAVLARAKQNCKKLVQTAQLSSTEHRGFAPVAAKGTIVDVALIRAAAALPETADEVCAVAEDLHANDDAVHLGAKATETAVKGLNASGELSKYKIIHFATHGAVAGEASVGAEPGLILTPPDTPSELDDGYLSASEVAALKLDADWVILSACNTAAGEAQDADALSGLARAFFYAGARSLLVSHWAVDSESTVKLITGALSLISADKSVSRAEAMRKSMLELIDHGAPYQAQPAYWAPFVLVGEGAK